jgi:hypothetical protein
VLRTRSRMDSPTTALGNSGYQPAGDLLLVRSLRIPESPRTVRCSTRTAYRAAACAQPRTSVDIIAAARLIGVLLKLSANACKFSYKESINCKI